MPQSDGAIAVAGLADWLRDALDDPGPFRLHLLSSGNSNRTMRVTSPTGRSWILRQPAHVVVSTRANSLAREYRVLSALAGTPVPAPSVIAFASEPAVVSAPSLLMELVDGAALTNTWPPGWTAGPDAISAAVLSALDALAALHAVDWRAVGLEGFGRPEGFLDRQVSHWRAQYERNQVRDLPLFEQISSWLEGSKPNEVVPALIHGDFHLDNCLFVSSPSVRLSAVIDWELATIGDPMVDLGLLLGFWGQERLSPPAMPVVQGLSRTPGVPTRQELAQYYAQRTGRSVESLSFYMALGFFKLAAINEGAYANYVSGRTNSEYARGLADDVPRLLAEAAAFAEL